MGEVTLSMWRADSTFKNQMPNETAALPFEGGKAAGINAERND
jgi:hypothetical protein